MSSVESYPSLPPELVKLLSEGQDARLTPQTGPGKGAFWGVSLAGIRETAAFLDSTPRAAMSFCLDHGVWPLRFLKNRGWLTAADQARLLCSHVAVIGCGGLGGHLIPLLARLGVGELTICDPDIFAETNLNRQFFCREDRIGRNKAEAAREELGRIASHLLVHALSEAATAENLPAILKEADAVADCLDNIETRRLVERASHEAGIPFVYGTVAGLEGFAAGLEGRAAGRENAAASPAPPDERSLLDVLYPLSGQTAGTSAEDLLGVPTPTPAGVAVLQAMLTVRALLGEGRTDPGALWHLDLSVPELELLRW